MGKDSKNIFKVALSLYFFMAEFKLSVRWSVFYIETVKGYYRYPLAVKTVGMVHDRIYIFFHTVSAYKHN